MATYQDLVRLTMEEAGVQQELPPAIALGSDIGMLSDFERWVAKAYEDVQNGHPEWKFRKDIGQLVLSAGQYTYNLPALLTGIDTTSTIKRDYRDTLFLTVIDDNGNVSQASLKWLPWADWVTKHGTEQLVQELKFASATDPSVTKGMQVTLSAPSGSDIDPEGVVVYSKYDATAQELTVRVVIERRLFTTSDTLGVGGALTASPTNTDIVYGQEGMPQEFAIDPDGQMLFYPIPDAAATYALTFPFTKAVDVFDTANPSANAVVPDEYKWAIVYRALMSYYEYATNPQGFNAAMSNYKHWMNRMGDNELPEIRFNPVQLY